MRRKRRVYYMVVDEGELPCIWWYDGHGWLTNEEADSIPSRRGCSNFRVCRNLPLAYRHALAINRKGGRALIEKWFWYRGVRYMQMRWITGFKPINL